MHYTSSHEWVKVTNSTAQVGVSDFAQKELGDIVFIELPEVGRAVEKGDEVAVLESTKAAADVYAPISGVIEAVNEQLSNHPELINESPQEQGWLIKIKMKDPMELDQLMDQEKYESFTQSK